MCVCVCELISLAVRGEKVEGQLGTSLCGAVFDRRVGNRVFVHSGRHGNSSFTWRASTHASTNQNRFTSLC